MKNVFAQAKQEALAAAHRAALRPALYEHASLRAILKMFPVRLRKHVSIYPSSYNASTQFSITLRDLDSLKHDERLLNVLWPFSTSEWECSSTDYTYDTPNRDFIFRRTLHIPMPDNVHTRWLKKHGHVQHYASTMPMEVIVFISAFVKADSDSCRIEVVDIKEEVVRTEVKKIVCA